MNLENLGVQEMNSKEMKTTDGGGDFADGLNAGTGATDAETGRGFWYWVGYGVGKSFRDVAEK